MEVSRAAAGAAVPLLEPLAMEIMAQMAPQAVRHLAVPPRVEVQSEVPEVMQASNRIPLLPPMVRLPERAAGDDNGGVPAYTRRGGNDALNDPSKATQLSLQQHPRRHQ